MKEYAISLGRGGFHFERKYLSETLEVKQAIFGFDVKQQKIDETDFGMLKLLAQDGSLSLRELATRLKLSPNGVKKRLESLEKRGIIQFYRTWMDYEKLGRKFFKSVITLTDWSEKLQKSFISFCNDEPSIVYLVLCSGSSDMEIEAETLDEAEFRALMVRFRNKFKDVVKDYEILNIYKEHKLIYFPFEKFGDI
jgi:DNA-binding Lrp family transcriptional regulator